MCVVDDAAGGVVTTPQLTLCDRLVHQVAAQEILPAEALATLGRYGLNPDREALSEAVAALQLRDTFLIREGNPYAFVGMDTNLSPQVSVWDLAVELAEDSLASHLLTLATPSAVPHVA